MILLLLSKLPLILLTCYGVQQFRRAAQRKMLCAYNYWYLGMSGYGFMMAWIHGLLYYGVEALWFVCAVGCVASLFLDDRKVSKEIKAAQEQLQQLKKARELWEQGILRDDEMERLLVLVEAH